MWYDIWYKKYTEPFPKNKKYIMHGFASFRGNKITDATQLEEFTSLWIRIQDVQLQPQMQRLQQMAMEAGHKPASTTP